MSREKKNETKRSTSHSQEKNTQALSLGIILQTQKQVGVRVRLVKSSGLIFSVQQR